MSSIILTSQMTWIKKLISHDGVVFSIFDYFDEVYIILLMLYTCLSVFRRRNENRNVIFIFSVLIWILCGLAGNIIHGTPLLTTLLGLFVSTKPLLLFWCLSQYRFLWSDFHRLMKWFMWFFPIIILSYLADFLTPSFRTTLLLQANDFRLGIRTLSGIFDLSTSASLWGVVFYIYITYYIRINRLKSVAFRIFSVFIIGAGLKIKDIFGFLMGLFFSLFKRINSLHLLSSMVLVYCLFILYSIYFPDHYIRYFEQEDNTGIARVALTHTAIKIAKDNVPFGVGFGQYGSPITLQYKSKVYAEYGINYVWGLNYDDNSRFMCDTFWPMILGETGIIGTIVFIFTLYFAFRPFIIQYTRNTQNLTVLFPSFLFVVFIFTSIGKQVILGPPHSFVLWGIAGMFNSLIHYRFRFPK